MDTPSPRKLTAILHIGDQKAGSKSIQRFLQTNHGALVYRGVTRNIGSLHKLYHSGLGAAVASVSAATRPEFGEWRITNAQDQQALHRDLSARLAAEVGAVPSTIHSMAFSFEGLLFLRPEEVRRLQEFLAPWFNDFRIIAYLRRQDLSAVSRYSTQIVNGRIGGARLPRLNPFAPQPPMLRYDKALDAWAEVFGASSLRPRLFQRSDFSNGDLIDDFIETASLGPNTGFDRTPPENESHSALTLAILNAVNTHMPPLLDGQPNPARGALVRALTAHAGADRATPSRGAAWVHYMRHYLSNRRLKQRWFPERDQLFEGGFSRYPWIAPRPPTLHNAGPLLAAAFTDLSATAHRHMLEARLTRVMKALAEQDPDTARQIARRTVKIAPSSVKTLILLGRAELACGAPMA
ncbi:MAG: hypothetical protein KTR21_18020, partial [Rhodobacteraceae bacterium]|nr:hypothetical protein [Paracoccaceae bacterium]